MGDALDSVALISDIYAWGEERLLPGLLPEFGPDGESSPTVEELLYELDQTDWSGGILIRQVRAPARPNTNKHTIRAKANSAEEAQCAMAEAPICYLDVITDQTPPGTQPFGRNTTHPTEPMVRPFEYWSGEQLGVSPIKSSNVASFRMIPVRASSTSVYRTFSSGVRKQRPRRQCLVRIRTGLHHLRLLNRRRVVMRPSSSLFSPTYIYPSSLASLRTSSTLGAIRRQGSTVMQVPLARARSALCSPCRRGVVQCDALCKWSLWAKSRA